MKSDFEPVIIKLPKTMKYVNIYTLSDVHIGAKECNEKALMKWVETVKNDKYGLCVLAGDMLNAGLRNSKTNVYEEVLMPFEQKERFHELLSPVKDKIIGMISGNHESRFVKEVGINPLYDVCCRWGIEDRYRERACFIDISVGCKKANRKQANYGVLVTHGSSKAKHEKFTRTIDGVDLFISGHTHENSNQVHGKLVFDRKNKVVRQAEYIKHVCTPFLGYGGYAMQGEYTPMNQPRHEVFTLSGLEKNIKFTTEAI